ncbi:maleylpyruvate isomerase N-terminal domain-containing protein [Nocardioides mangrovi]|uniref:Maleylpyruvate isomerase N-terminal domain-containing protein n=1 Tax=Nocardioides mangrovi TaxID=2874580 RepID=A0ABS7UAV5_9ACTN|nr:maleylpyruvate isomerase N-terminal domain-containing protein [Nocardioides mangrovi]MBZ5738109.1 maleylpyruvate isomerase N-terminal domain-containing protein [Nocardioides mangrovi]
MTDTAARTDWGSLYREHVAAISALGSELTDDQLGRVVPGSPAWTVHDVFAHLAGGASDAVTGRMDGAPGPEWTARHVGERHALPVTDLTAEIRSHQDALAESVVDNPRPALVWDIAVHHADLHEALGLGMLGEPMWQPVLAGVAPMKFGSAGIPPDVDGYELFRALFSRRSRAQMRAWGLALSPEQLDELCIFGPREDDQPVP